MGFFAIHGLHGPQDESVTWADGGGEERKKEHVNSKKRREKETLTQDSVFDMSSFGKPMPTFLRHRFRLQHLLNYLLIYDSWLKVCC